MPYIKLRRLKIHCRAARRDDATGFFSPHAAGKSVMFVVALCHGRKPHTPSAVSVRVCYARKAEVPR